MQVCKKKKDHGLLKKNMHIIFPPAAQILEVGFSVGMILHKVREDTHIKKFFFSGRTTKKNTFFL